MNDNVKIENREEEKNVGEILKNNNAIFNYIYDKYGFRIGIVVAMKGVGRWHPRMGWSLFCEVPHKTVVHRKMSTIPYYKNICIFNKTLNEFVPAELEVPEVIEIYPEDKFAKMELFYKAIDRANYNSFEYYVNKDPQFGQAKTDFRSECETLQADVYNENYNCFNIKDAPVFDMDDEAEYGTFKAIKKTVKSTEFRAFTYFKN